MKLEMNKEFRGYYGKLDNHWVSYSRELDYIKYNQNILQGLDCYKVVWLLQKRNSYVYGITVKIESLVRRKFIV